MNKCMADLAELHAKFGDLPAAVAGWPGGLALEFLKFRMRFLQEELDEMVSAAKGRDAGGVVDALVDLVVVAVGTMHAFGVDGVAAWDRVHLANAVKTAGANAARSNPFGLPDLVKPPGWSPPSHADNVGTLGLILRTGG